MRSIATLISGWGLSSDPLCDLWDYYANEAAKLGYEAGPENFGYLVPTVLAETEEKAQEIANNFVFGGGQNAFAAPEFTMLPGYNSKSAIRMLAKQTTGSWLGVSGDKLKQSASGDEEGAVDYDEVRQEAASGPTESTKQLPGNRRDAEDSIAEDQDDPAGAAPRRVYYV